MNNRNQFHADKLRAAQAALTAQLAAVDQAVTALTQLQAAQAELRRAVESMHAAERAKPAALPTQFLLAADETEPTM